MAREIECGAVSVDDRHILHRVTETPLDLSKMSRQELIELIRKIVNGSDLQRRLLVMALLFRGDSLKTGENFYTDVKKCADDAGISEDDFRMLIVPIQKRVLEKLFKLP